jgi:hypothetical protein
LALELIFILLIPQTIQELPNPVVGLHHGISKVAVAGASLEGWMGRGWQMHLGEGHISEERVGLQQRFPQ